MTIKGPGEMLLERLKKYKMVAAIKEPKYIEKAVKNKEHLSAVLLMTGTILTVKRYVDFFQSKGLPVILHVEKIGGLEMDSDGIDFVKRIVKPAAIVATKNNILKKAKSNGLFVIQRIFLIDTEVFHNLENGTNQTHADVIEIMPSRAPDFLKKIIQVSKVPVITGGLLTLPEHAKEAINNGVLAVTTSNSKLWEVGIGNF